MSGLALLTGATALVAAAGGHRSFFATLLLGLLAGGMAHALVVEIQRQARRGARAWGRHDSVNAILLACWAVSAVALTTADSLPVRILGCVLAPGYAAAGAYFVVERLRTLAAASAVAADPAGTAPASGAAAPSRPAEGFGAAPSRPAEGFGAAPSRPAESFGAAPSRPAESFGAAAMPAAASGVEPVLPAPAAGESTVDPATAA
ncbi:hypothetical protein [Actinoplanes sp. DH11]|uniref:hypothetical protein n=1 Tax=Actinoplanes sp. DH11 TaxID=2857011 RepID=UPI001E3A44B2|nr:hypothetical protein [Actinoplanes sp. DH11]